MEGQGLGLRRQQSCQSLEKLRKKNRECFGCRANAVLRLYERISTPGNFKKLVKSLPSEWVSGCVVDVLRLQEE